MSQTGPRCDVQLTIEPEDADMTKFTSALAAVALLGCGAAFAANQTPSATSGSTAAPASSTATTPAPRSTHMAQAGTSAQPSAPSATPVKKPTWKECRKQATDKGLKGKERSQFIKDCHSGKNS